MTNESSSSSSFVLALAPLPFRGGGRQEASRLAEVTDQLDRASLSALLNTAEGNGKRHRQTRAKFFDDARGSATQCAACLDALVAKHAVLLRIVSMLTKLVQRFEGTGRTREDAPEYGSESSSSSSSKGGEWSENEGEGQGRKEKA